LPPVAGTLCATSPLDSDSARAFERLTAAPLIEIYGSSETGVIGTRRPASDERFSPLDDIALAHDAKGLAIGGGHVTPGTTLRDRVELFADGSFAVLGRDADMVKIGGKRASLSMLNRALRDVPGVLDAEYVTGEGSGLSPRLAALVVAPGVDRETILAMLRERIDPVFLPRPLHLVSSLERNAIGKLSTETLRRRVDALSLGAPAAESP
jgi:acyl-coenzyme A synthetase/AMP-(fatty) acid ligase